MEENTNAQPVAETGTQVCKECGRTLPLEDFQRRRNGNVDNVCKACRAEKARIGIAKKKEKKVDIPEKIAKAVSAPSPASEAALKEAVKTECVEIAQLCRYLTEFKMAGLALWGMMPSKEEDIDNIIEAEWMISFCQEIFAAAAELKRDWNNVVPALVAKRLGAVGQMFVEDLGNAFYPLAKECDTSEQKELPFVKDVVLGYPGHYFYDGERMHFCGPVMEEKQKEQKPEVISPVTYVADFSDAALLDELRRRGYKGRVSKCEEVEI